MTITIKVEFCAEEPEVEIELSAGEIELFYSVDYHVKEIYKTLVNRMQLSNPPQEAKVLASKPQPQPYYPVPQGEEA